MRRNKRFVGKGLLRGILNEPEQNDQQIMFTPVNPTPINESLMGVSARHVFEDATNGLTDRAENQQPFSHGNENLYSNVSTRDDIMKNQAQSCFINPLGGLYSQPNNGVRNRSSRLSRIENMETTNQNQQQIQDNNGSYNMNNASQNINGFNPVNIPLNPQVANGNNMGVVGQNGIGNNLNGAIGNVQPQQFFNPSNGQIPQQFTNLQMAQQNFNQPNVQMQQQFQNQPNMQMQQQFVNPANMQMQQQYPNSRNNLTRQQILNGSQVISNNQPNMNMANNAINNQNQLYYPNNINGVNNQNTQTQPQQANIVNGQQQIQSVVEQPVYYEVVNTSEVSIQHIIPVETKVINEVIYNHTYVPSYNQYVENRRKDVGILNNAEQQFNPQQNMPSNN